MFSTLLHSAKPLLAFCIAIALIGCGSSTATQPAPVSAPKASPVSSSSTPLQHSSYSDPFAYCAAVGTIDAPDARYTGPAIPDSIIQAMLKQGVITAQMPPEFQKHSVWRCMNSSVWACNFGANIPCQEKADPSQAPTTAMEDFCKANPDSVGIPAAVTGRATVYLWDCKNGKPEITSQYTTADPQGYLTLFWHELSSK
ncbi:MAG TPA: hypothetical protein VMT91_11005 [Anaerolineales bacterium]|nr:hypothetical protein [Anaerolineales bacterium]